MSGRDAARAAMGAMDANHAELAAVYVELGCSVVDTHGLGFGFPDAIVGLVGTMHLVEFKTAEGVLSASQVRFMGEWRGPKPMVVRTREDVIAHVQLIRMTVARIAAKGGGGLTAEQIQQLNRNGVSIR